MIGSQMQKAIFAALTAAPAVAGGRIYDRVPATAAYPRITIGDDQVLDDGNSCEEGWEVFSNVHIWSRSNAGSKAEAKDLAAQVVDRLVIENLSVFGFSVVIAAFQDQRTQRDPDGLTEHTVVTVRHVLQPA